MTGRRSTVSVTVAAGAIVALLAVLAAAAPAGAATPAVQVTAERIEPDPRVARGDRGRPDGCPSRKQLRSKLRCVYGDRDADTTVVVFGDSKVMQYFPVLDPIAQRRGWRLVGLTRAGCPPMTVRYAFRCDRWRKRALRRLERIDPELVVTGSGIAYQVIAKGRRLGRPASRPILRRAYVRTLRRISGGGAKVAVAINPPRAPSDPPSCVQANRDRLDRCAFERGSEPYRSYVVRAAREARVQRLDISQAVCPGGTCPAVIDSVLVQRDRVHLTATFVRTLEPWFDGQLPAIG
jgi:hypothetical protein